MASKADRAAAREKYCNDQLTPILQAMVAEMLKVLPGDPDEYMRTWLDAKIVEEGGTPPTSDPIVLSACPVSSAPIPIESRPSVGTPLEITGEIVAEEEATRLSTLTQLIADTPGAARATMFTVRGSVVPLAAPEEIKKMSTLSQIIADTPGAARNTVITVRGTVVPAADVERLSSIAQVVADTPSAAPRGTVVTVRVSVTAEEAKRLSTLSQIIANTPGAARGTVHSAAPLVALQGVVVSDDVPVAVVSGAAPPPDEGQMVTIIGSVVSEVQIVAEQNRLSTLTQLLNDTPGASRGTLLTIRGSVAPTNLTPQEEHKMSTLSAIIADTPGAARGTVVTVRGTLKSRPGEIVTAQVVVTEEEAKRLSTLSQLIADTPGASRATTVTVRGTVITPAEATRMSTLSALMSDTPGAARATLASVLSKSNLKGEALVALDSHEEQRKVSQKRASQVANSEQLRVIAEMQHAEHDAKNERVSNRKSAIEGIEAEQKSLVADHGHGARKVPSLPDQEELKSKLSKVGISAE